MVVAEDDPDPSTEAHSELFENRETHKHELLSYDKYLG